ncbi:MAG: NADH-quinone oxidoreductase subunit NuoN [Burkholderiales bacterium]|nr:NADH-quinone oxidoreductase subunit NuoN [Burkholderiales bacterium]
MTALIPAYPEIVIALVIGVVLLADLWLPRERKVVLEWICLAGIALAAAITLALLSDGTRGYAFSRMFVSDPLSNLLKVGAYLAVAVTFIYSRRYMTERGLLTGEYYILAMFVLLGIMVMISANHFVTLYLGLEMLSLSLYAMVALNRDSPVSTEAAIKYFVLGALASGLLLYGVSMIYGGTGGQLNLELVARELASGEARRGMVAFGLVFVVAGLAFKLGVVPFHMWIPDVYHGAPTAITLMIGAAPKLAGFAIAIRLLVVGLISLAADWQAMLVILAVLSMAIGNLAAIAQTNLKRMLAYSTISHMGFMLLGLLSGVVGGNRLNTVDAYGSALFYVVTYVLTTLAAFGVILMMARRGFEAEDLSDFKGLNARSPWFAWMTLIVMFSLAGIPPTVGFYAKLSVLQAAVGAQMVWLAVVAVLFSLVGAFYYLRVVKLMFFDEPADATPLAEGAGVRMLLSANGFALLVLGLMPGALMALCLDAMKGSL